MKFIYLLLFAGLFGITSCLEDKDETIQVLTKMVYDLKGEVEHLTLKIEGYSKPCNCTRLENLINDNAESISRNSQNIKDLKLEIGYVQDEIQDLASVVDSNAANITIVKEKISVIEEASQNNSIFIETIQDALTSINQYIKENSAEVSELDQAVKNNKDGIEKNTANITANAEKITHNEETSVSNLERIEAIDFSVQINAQHIEENSQMVGKIDDLD